MVGVEISVSWSVRPGLASPIFRAGARTCEACAPEGLQNHRIKLHRLKTNMSPPRASALSR